MEDDGVDHAAQTAAGGGDADGEGAFGAEVGRDDCDAGDEEAAGAYAHAEALGEHKLPVSGAEARHHEPEYYHGTTAPDEGKRVAAVEERTGEDGGAAEEEGFDAADPADIRVGAVGDEGGAVVVLPDAEGVDEAPAVEEHEEAAGHLQPGYETSIGYTRLRRDR